MNYDIYRKASLCRAFLACFVARFMSSENEHILCLSCLLKSCLHPQIYLMLPLQFSSSFTVELSVISFEQTTQWPMEKVQKGKQRSTKHTYKIKDGVTRTLLKAE
jgi:hypothetical protein